MDEHKELADDADQGIKYVKAEDFEIINNRKRITHQQPFTDE
jgi:hypothetical protein